MDSTRQSDGYYKQREHGTKYPLYVWRDDDPDDWPKTRRAAVRRMRYKLDPLFRNAQFVRRQEDRKRQIEEDSGFLRRDADRANAKYYALSPKIKKSPKAQEQVRVHKANKKKVVKNNIFSTTSFPFKLDFDVVDHEDDADTSSMRPQC